jgi:hypothetical protein
MPGDSSVPAVAGPSQASPDQASPKARKPARNARESSDFDI